MATPVPSSADTDLWRYSIRLPRPLWIGVTAVFLAVLAVGLRFGLPALQRHRTIHEIELLGGSDSQENGGPDWLRKWVGDDTMQRLGFDQVISVNLGQTEAMDATLRYFGRFRELKSLQLDGSRVTDAGLAHLSTLKKLESLSLAKTNIGDRGLSCLQGLDRLKELSLAGTRASAAGLSQLRGISSLEKLDLCATGASDEALMEVARFHSLRQLNIRGGRFGDAGLKELRRLSRLKHVDLGSANVSRETVSGLKEAIPGLNLSWEWDYALRKIDGEPVLVTRWITIVFAGGTIVREATGSLVITGTNELPWLSHWGPEYGVSWASTSGLLLIDFVGANAHHYPHRPWRTQFTRCGTRLTCRGRTVKLPETSATLVFARDGSVRLDGKALTDLEEVPP